MSPDTSVVYRVGIMHGHVNPKNNQPAPLISDEVYEIVMEVRAL